MQKLWPLLALVLLGACGKSDNEPGPGGVTVGEARALDEAAAILEERRPSAEALQPSQLELPEAAPSDEAAGEAAGPD